MGKVSKFTRHEQTYTCWHCQKLTRDTGSGEQGTGVCKACFDTMMLENEHNDYGHPRDVRGCPACRAHAMGIEGR